MLSVGYASSNSYASFVLSKLLACFISRWTHRWRMNQLFYNIFNPMENFFFFPHRGICLRMSWACTIGIWSTSRNWIWLDKFTSYVIIIVLIMECGARWLSSIPGCQVLRFMGRMTRSKYLYHSVAMFLLLLFFFWVGFVTSTSWVTCLTFVSRTTKKIARS